MCQRIIVQVCEIQFSKLSIYEVIHWCIAVSFKGPWIFIFWIFFICSTSDDFLKTEMFILMDSDSHQLPSLLLFISPFWFQIQQSHRQDLPDDPRNGPCHRCQVCQIVRCDGGCDIKGFQTRFGPSLHRGVRGSQCLAGQLCQDQAHLHLKILLNYILWTWK